MVARSVDLLGLIPRGIGARMLWYQLEMGHDATAVVIPAAKVQVRHLDLLVNFI